jgi:tetratricopeptide (TPR) repeat protein
LAPSHVAQVSAECWLESGLAGADAVLAQTPGAAVGPYRLVRELGQGGMGSVWRAERSDGPVKRPLALKLPRLAWGGGLARERDILGALDHPHIARLLDAGVGAAGRPWLALEYVDGLPLDTHARQAALPLRERVRLLLQVASVVADARARLDEADALWPAAGPGDAQLRLKLLVRRAAVHRADDPERAAAAAEQALALAATLPPSAEGTNAAFLAAEARVMQGEAERALPVVRDAVLLLQRQPALGASILAPLFTLQGDAEASLGRFDAAEASYRRGIEVESARGGSGTLPHYLRVQLARFFVKQERWAETAVLIAPTAAWARRMAGAYETTVPMATATEGEALLGLGRVAEAQAALDLAVQQVSRMQDAADIAPRIEALRASAWVASGRLDDAERSLAAIDATQARRGLPSAPQIEHARRELLLARGRPNEALAAWRAERAAGQRPEQPDPRHEPVAAVAWARLLHAAGQPVAALAQAQAAVEAFEARQAAGTPWRGVTWARAWQVAAAALLDLGRPGEAAEAKRRASALLAAQPSAEARR